MLACLHKRAGRATDEHHDVVLGLKDLRGLASILGRACAPQLLQWVLGGTLQTEFESC